MINKSTLQNTGQNNSRLQKQCGASLIEVMVAVTILSIGLLGLGLLQVKSLQLNTDAYLRSQATLIASEFIEDMRANPTASYVVDNSTKPSAVCTSCTAEEKMRDAAIIRWYAAQENLLPSNASEVTVAGTPPRLRVEMKWMERSVPVTQIWVLTL